MNEGFLWHIIASYLPPKSILACAEVSLSWFAWARADGSWKTHVNRLVNSFPELKELFDHFAFSESLRAVEPVRKRRKSFESPTGYWIVFARYLQHPIITTGVKHFFDQKWRLLIKFALDRYHGDCCFAYHDSEITWKTTSFKYTHDCEFWHRATVRLLTRTEPVKLWCTSNIDISQHIHARVIDEFILKII